MQTVVYIEAQFEFEVHDKTKPLKPGSS